MTEQRIELAEARVISMRELNQRTSAVIDEVNGSGEPAVVTKHGQFVALITPLAGRRIESLVLGLDPKIRELIDEQDRRERAGGTRSVPLEHAEAWLKDE